MSEESIIGVSFVAQWLTDPTRIHENVGLVPGLAQCVKGANVVASFSVGHRHSLDVVLLWLWCRPAAVALIQPLAWELPCVEGAALKRQKKKRQKKKKKKFLRSSN